MSLKRKIKKLKRRISKLEDMLLGSLWVIVNMINLYDSNMEIIQKTFEAVVAKINEIQDNDLPEKEDIQIEKEKENGTTK